MASEDVPVTVPQVIHKHAARARRIAAHRHALAALAARVQAEQEAKAQEGGDSR